ncbi:glutamate mutase L [Vagococcus sp. CY52-2]|nr:glutamate mutase L [Vagococcus sp. CY52-2]UNM89998.1 glutamate mutase L [Vagococcus sp. CY52-2]
MLKVYSYGLKPHDIEEIEQLQPDVILLSGGTMEEMKKIF